MCQEPTEDSGIESYVRGLIEDGTGLEWIPSRTSVVLESPEAGRPKGSSAKAPAAAKD
jgi:hypothetical protein